MNAQENKRKWLCVFLAAACFAAAPANAQRDNFDETSESGDAISESIQQLFNSLWIPRSRFLNSPHLRSAFRTTVAEVRNATVEIRTRGKRIAYGGVVGPDGWVLTKASLIKSAVTCRLKDGREFDARLVGVDAETDLAMLKVAAKDLPTLDLSASQAPQELMEVSLQREAGASDSEPDDSLDDSVRPGDWLVSVGLGRDPFAIGVVSVMPRAIEKRPAFLGVALDLEHVASEGQTAGVKIQSVSPGGAAEEAGIESGDRITKIDHQPTPTVEELKRQIAARHPGDRVEIELIRGDESVVLLAMLRSWAPNPAERRAHYQNNLGGKLSGRRFGFPSALQHDTVLEPNECGGPVVDLDGRVLGFNIARAGRTESYALPVELVRTRLFDLMSGSLAPAGEPASPQ